MSSENKNTGSKGLLDQWKKRKKRTSNSQLIARSPEDKTIPSKGQHRLWLLQQLYPNSPFYQYAHRYKITGKLDIKILEKSFQSLINRHEILRSNFVENEGELSLEIHDQLSFKCPVYDLSHSAEQDKEAAKITHLESHKLFDLEKGPLLRAIVLKFSESRFQIILSIHHIIGDRWSMQLINEELYEFYKRHQNSELQALAPLNIQYADFSLWQNAQKPSSKDLEYWKQKLSGELPLLNLHGDFKRPLKPSFNGSTATRLLTHELSAKLKQLSKEEEVTMFVYMLAAFKVLLFRYTNQKDLVIGSPYSIRDKRDLERIIGFFNETLVLRTELQEDWTFNTLLSALKKTSLEAFEHKNVGFEELVRHLKIERQEGINPIFQAMFLFNNFLEFSPPEIGLKIQEESIDLNVSKFDLTLFAHDLGDQISLSLEFALDIFNEMTAARMLQHLEVILEAISSNSEIPISQLPLLKQKERIKILEDWNNTTAPYPKYESIHQMIEEQAKHNPHQIAVQFNDQSISYASLNKKSNVLAAKLIQLGVEANTIVGLYTNRGTKLIIAILGILKAGAAYLPLDPEYPEERIQFMIEDSGAAYVVSQAALLGKLNFTKIPLINLEETINYNTLTNAPNISCSPDSLAYIIYTSGSTGKPKGVKIQHKNLLHSTLSRFAYYPSNPYAFLLLSSFSFDSSVAGVFWTLCSGGTLVIAPHRIEQDIFQLGELISNNKVSHTLMLPSLYSAVLNHAAFEQLKNLKIVMVAGEACPLKLVSKHYKKLPNTKLYNEYGPTEASVWCIAHAIHANETEFVPIGKPIPNAQTYILNPQLKPAPIGVPGELHIGGLGLSKGYLNRPELTAECFIDHPFKKNEKLYKTGDLARYHDSGIIEFLGRVDHQIKIRGFRVELGEIQKKILDYTGISEALVIAHQAHNETQKRLVAYVSGIPEHAIPTLRNNLENKLPNYMVPAVFILLNSFPLLPNGKLDRKSLPDPNSFNLTSNKEFVPPSNELEKQLVTIWSEILKIDKIGIKDNFFALGGDSILSIQVVSKSRDVGIFLEPNQLFEHQTIESLVKSIHQKPSKTKTTHNQAATIEDLSSYKLSPLQNAFWFNSQSRENDQGILQLEFSILGSIDIPLFKKAWQKTSKRHSIMRAYINQVKGEKAKQYIAPQTTLPWNLLDWSTKDKSEQNLALEDLRQADAEIGINLEEAPTSRITLIQLEKDKQILFWTCHHIFLDGWSCGIILKDAFDYYKKAELKGPISVNPIPSFLSYLNWHEKRDKSAEQLFWNHTLKSFKKPLLFKKKTTVTSSFKNAFVTLTKSETTGLNQFCQQNSISLSTLLQGAWALLLARLFQSNDIVFGTTVSGRFIDFPKIELTSGLFMNVIPLRLTLNPEESLGLWLQEFQKQQGKYRLYENTSLENIKAAINWPSSLELFDSLFVFGNFLKNGLKIGNLEVQSFQGNFSSSYPLTIRVNPLEALEIDFRYDSSKIVIEEIQWIKSSFIKLLKFATPEKSEERISDILNNLEDQKILNTSIQNSTKTRQSKIIAPRNTTEETLCNIWKQLFNRTDISIKDDFFHLGGNSIMAIQLFSKIENELNCILPPATLFQNRTIELLSKAITLDSIEENKNQLVIPLRAEGNKPPLFCIHGGGAHVFFYKKMAEILPEGYPVYSFQPPSLDGTSKFPESIEAMAKLYLDKIQKIQSKGPYHLLGTCFSNAVVLEMARQLQKQGNQLGKLFIIDSAPAHLFGNDQDGKSKTFSRFIDMLSRGDFKKIKDKIQRRFQEKQPVVNTLTKKESKAEENLRITIDKLNKLYADYSWLPIDSKIYFIRSSEFHNRKDKQFHLTQWKKLAKGGVQTEIVPGHHISLFEEPEVQHLALKINQCLQTKSI